MPLFVCPFQAVGYESWEVETHTYKLKYESKDELFVTLSDLCDEFQLHFSNKDHVVCVNQCLL